LTSSELDALAQMLARLHPAAVFFQEKLIPATKPPDSHPGVVDSAAVVHRIQ